VTIDWQQVAEAYLHPAVLLILTELAQGPASPSRIHRKVGEQNGFSLPTISYHMRALERRALIVVVDRVHGRRTTVEKIYDIRGNDEHETAGDEGERGDLQAHP
jgi:DNA-binding transcriptional ArsR family regulator